MYLFCTLQSTGTPCWIRGTQRMGITFLQPRRTPRPHSCPMVVRHHSHTLLSQQKALTTHVAAALQPLASQHTMYFDDIPIWSSSQDVPQDWNTVSVQLAWSRLTIQPCECQLWSPANTTQQDPSQTSHSNYPQVWSPWDAQFNDDLDDPTGPSHNQKRVDQDATHAHCCRARELIHRPIRPPRWFLLVGAL